MRTISALVFVGLCALALAGQSNVVQQGKQNQVVDKVFLEKQKNILRLLKYVNQGNGYQDQAQIGNNYNIENNMQQYEDQQAVQNLVNNYNNDMLPRGQVFSIMYEQQRNETVALAQTLISAKDYDTFYKTACWARINVNEGQYVYALTAAILQREDTQGIVLPPIYEVNPYLFVNSEVIDKAYEIKMKYGGNYQGSDKQQKYVIQANYSGWYLNSNQEQSALSYYTEDVGINAFYYYYNMYYPFWMSGVNSENRGEIYYYVHQQLLARYYLERLSKGYGSIQVYDWEEPIKTGYVPSLRYPNGLELPVRPAYAHLVYNPQNQAYRINGQDNVFQIQQIQDYERRIRDAIDLGYIIAENGQKINLYEPQGFNLLGKIMEGNADSPNGRFYGNLQVIARQVLGYSSIPADEYQINPSALEQFETSLRDPAFYQLYKRITYYFLQYKSNLPSYNVNQLLLPGVKIQNVQVDKLITYFDNFDVDITNALYVSEQELQQDNLQVIARQQRLNHKPFTYKINLNSDKATDVVVRVFLGPQQDEQGREIPLNDNRVNFVELDKFVYSLNAGNNVIERNSQQGQTGPDSTSFRVLYKRVLAALQGQEQFQINAGQSVDQYPNRYLLPRGSKGGQVYQLYVHIASYQQQQQQQQQLQQQQQQEQQQYRGNYGNYISSGAGNNGLYVDNLPLGYPLDRKIQDENVFSVPNSYMQQVVIYHKTESAINSARN